MPRIDWSRRITARERSEQARREAEAAARAARDRRLAATDWTQLEDAPLPGARDREQMRKYRQALRDITDQPGWPERIDWPEPPGPAGERGRAEAVRARR